MDMIAQNLLQRLLQQMAGGMVAHDVHAALGIHRGGDGIAGLEGAVGDVTDVDKVAGAGRDAGLHEPDCSSQPDGQGGHAGHRD